MSKVAAIFACISIAVSGVRAGNMEVPRAAPKLTYNIPGKEPQDLSQYLGKVVALEFIFTTCPHCKAASKLMSRLQTELGPKGLQVLDIAVNDNADLLVENFAKEQATTFPVGWVLQQQMVSFMGFSEARFVVPQFVLIDRNGMIRHQTPPLEDKNWDSLMAEDAIRKNIEQLLAAPAKHAVR